MKIGLLLLEAGFFAGRHRTLRLARDVRPAPE
jgi:hypothetical protein